MLGRTLKGVFGGLLALGLASCYESADVTVHKPGVYKGNQDPLLQKLKSPELQQALVERFEMGQMDR